MSAFQCSKQHVIYLVQAAANNFDCWSGDFRWTTSGGHYEKLEKSDYYTQAEIAAMLETENRASLTARYDDREGAAVTSLVFSSQEFSRRRWLIFKPVEVIKAAHCFQYQACEHVEWEKSNAAAFIRSLINVATMHLPGYDAAPWGEPSPEVTPRPHPVSQLDKLVNSLQA